MISLARGLTHLAEFLNVASPCVAQFQAFCEPFNEQLLLGRGLVPGSRRFRPRLNGGFEQGALL